MKIPVFSDTTVFTLSVKENIITVSLVIKAS